MSAAAEAVPYSPFQSGASTPPAPDAGFAQQVREETCAIKLETEKFGVTRALNSAQVKQAAEGFGAQQGAMSASKKLLNTRAKKFAACTKIINQAKAYWKAYTVQLPGEKGVRLARRAFIAEFTTQMESYQAALALAVAEMDEWYQQEKQDARQRLGDLYDANDYPPTIIHDFDIRFTFPNIEPPNWLKQLHPELYREQQERIAKQFDMALAKAEDVFTVELSKMVEHLHDVLSPGVEGEKKIFKGAAVTNLQEFFKRFKALGMVNNAALNSLVQQAELIIGGVDPDKLRKDADFRADVIQKLGEVRNTLGGMVETKTRVIDLGDDDLESNADGGDNQNGDAAGDGAELF